jgi:hypothetical protein
VDLAPTADISANVRGAEHLRRVLFAQLKAETGNEAYEIENDF